MWRKGGKNSKGIEFLNLKIFALCHPIQLTVIQLLWISGDEAFVLRNKKKKAFSFSIPLFPGVSNLMTSVFSLKFNLPLQKINVERWGRFIELTFLGC